MTTPRFLGKKPIFIDSYNGNGDFYLEKFEVSVRDQSNNNFFSAPMNITLELVCESYEYNFLRDWMDSLKKKNLHIKYMGFVYGCVPLRYKLFDNYIFAELSADYFDFDPMTKAQERKLKLEKIMKNI